MRRIILFILSVVLLASMGSACSLTNYMKVFSYDTSKINDSVINANNEFAFDIFKELSKEDADKSIFISPLSISTTLAMTYNGVESTTKDAMSKALRYNDIDRNIINESYSNLLRYLQKADKKLELNIANSIWIREGEEIKEDFLKNNKSNFDAVIKSLDFSKDTAAGTINKWISDSTKGKIDKMVESPIDPDVIMYLINGIYFKGQWSEKFDSERTYQKIFKAFNGNKENVMMMRRKGEVEYKKGDDYEIVRLPYGNGKISMYCILPDETIDINGYIDEMNAEKWINISENIEEVDDVVLEMPRFKLEYGIKNLNKSLTAIGMGEAFSEQADFTGIREDVQISRVLHKAVIEVNEEGSEAAGATVVSVKSSATYTEYISFIADRPFIFVIADDTTGAILFMGKLLSVD